MGLIFNSTRPNSARGSGQVPPLRSGTSLTCLRDLTSQTVSQCPQSAFALPSAHPARGVDDELRWGPISMRVCTTCFAPSGPREVLDAALFHCGDRFLLARPRPSSSPMACIAHVRSHSCFARPHHAARGLGSQALRQPRLRAVVASSVLDAPSRQHGCRGPPSSEGRVGELHAHRDGVRAAASRASPRSRACPPRMRRSPSGRRPVKRGGRNERLDGQGRVAGRKGRR